MLPRPRILLSLVLLCCAAHAAQGANIFTNASFETGVWGGSQTFASPNDATTLTNSSATITGWTTSVGSTWVQAPTRATDQSRLLWLGPPIAGSAECISQSLAVSPAGDASLGLVAGNTYDLMVDYAFYDPNDPTGSNSALSRFEIYYLLGTNSGGDNPFTQTFLLDTSDHVSPWNNGGNSGLQWNQTNLSFAMPDITGYDYLKIFISAPKSTLANSSRGVLVDNSMLSLRVGAVPEPGSLMLAGTALGLMLRRKRK